MLHAEVNVPLELSLTAAGTPRNPTELDVDLRLSGPGGYEAVVPAFWAGEGRWTFRIAAPAAGRYTWTTTCGDTTDNGLHGRTGQIEVRPYTGSNPLFKRGRVRVAQDHRHFEQGDGTPFFWLADTWWMALCRRMSWPQDFKDLTRDRVEKGFSVIHIIAGLYPDMPAFDERGANEAGYPWDREYKTLNPSYFDMADHRIAWLVSSGLVPCVVACWGYFLPWMGVEKMKRHWRNLVARWGAYPVVWCLAGEATMPYYLSETKEKDAETQRRGWTEIAKYVRRLDPWHNAITIHPTSKGREQVDDPSVLDFEMLQTGHSDRKCLPNTIDVVTDSYAREPPMPILNSEVCYEGIGEACRQEVQRLMFWSCVLSGAAGHSYGANGIWQVNTRAKTYGASPHGMAWGHTPWDEAAQLPGSRQLGIAKRVLEKLPWWRFTPHPEWVEPRWTKQSYDAPYAAGIPGEVRVVYMPLEWEAPTVVGLEPGLRYNARLVNPCTGEEQVIGAIQGDAAGKWPIGVGNKPWRTLPIYQDWVLVLQKA